MMSASHESQSYRDCHSHRSVPARRTLSSRSTRGKVGRITKSRAPSTAPSWSRSATRSTAGCGRRSSRTRASRTTCGAPTALHGEARSEPGALIAPRSSGLPLPWEPLDARAGRPLRAALERCRELLPLAADHGASRSSRPACASRSICPCTGRCGTPGSLYAKHVSGPAADGSLAAASAITRGRVRASRRRAGRRGLEAIRVQP